ncbi:enoyl-CoA hydratase-related protein [Pseudonocardia xishanensis]|uniref:Enoyl-CoA hydratase n=1 Tax=Pseudonocardia xishanensis TaxID=630995 RepID=A0ABP8RZ31_9PSEU
MTEASTMSVTDDVAVITLNHPDRHNAWTDAMGEAYFAHLSRCDADPTIRVVVVTGAGSSYCVGGDFAELEAISADRSLGEDEVRHRRHAEAAALRVPVIAAINGACAGIGLVQAMWCDVRFTCSRARFSTAYARRGLPAEQGLSWLLTRSVGVGRAADLLLSGRTFDGAEAGALGLATVVGDSGADVTRHALDYATDIARNCSPAALAAIKRQLWSDLDRASGPAIARSEELTAELVAGDDFAEGVRAFGERRTPRFDRAPKGYTG